MEATRQCLRALADGLGNRKVGLVAVTGSARELIGAYLDTSHVYNEISAHAAGAAQFDPEVDTIFEIGGQDSKYILLRNGVPIDYAMNAVCSAGTGSFLDECAQGDLDLPLTEIADAALRATAPVQFNATCAAFINSDIRTALQEGYSRDDVTAGLVYSIVQNYLTKVKGRRAVGKRVFFQGGVRHEPGRGPSLRPLPRQARCDSPAPGVAGSDWCGPLGVGEIQWRVRGRDGPGCSGCSVDSGAWAIHLRRLREPVLG